MITFEQLYHLNLSNLAFAEDQFHALVKKFEGMTQSFEDDVLKHFNQAGWNFSLGGMSMVAYSQLGYANREFDDAVKEVRGIRGILEDSHQELKRCRENLKDLVNEANAKGLKVDSRGDVSAVEDLDTEVNRSDPSIHEDIAKQKSQIERFKIEINTAVQDAESADAFATLALQKVAGDVKSEGFNGKARASVDSYEADRASKLMQKFDENDKLSQKEMDELDQIMRLNKNDSEFSRMILDKLGPEKTLRIADDLSDIRGNEDYSKLERKHYAAIEKAFAANVGIASKDKSYFSDWHKGIRKQCDENPRGYQTLATLLKHGDGSYPERLTASLANDMIATEKVHPGVWDVHIRVGPGEKPDAQNIDDPVDDMLGVMSRDPDAATHYLDPRDNDHLKYLLDERDWPNIEGRQVTLRGEPVGMAEVAPTDSRYGLGHAIEAATTGDKPGSPIDMGEHTEAQAKIFADTMHALDGGPQKESIHPNLRQPLANTLADYTKDTHQILSGVNYDYIGEAKAGQDGVFTDQNGAHAAPEFDELTRVMRGISQDPDAYGTMHKAETVCVAENINNLPEDSDADDVRAPVRKGSRALGVYDAIREDVALDLRDQKNADADWNAKVSYHLIGTPLTPIPVVGDAAQRSVDAWTASIASEVKADNNAEAAAKVAEESLASQQEVGFLVDRWARERGMDPNGDPISGVQGDILDARNTQRDNALHALG